MPAVTQQVRRAGVEPGEQVEGWDRPAGPGAGLAVKRDQHHRTVMALGEPRGDDPDHAGMPALAGEHVRSAVAQLATMRDSASNRIRVST